jgi:phosphoribosylaminoimidazole carboxylase PurE protein
VVAGKVVIIMGSGRDEEFANLIGKALDRLGVPYERRVASAHRTPIKVLEILREYEDSWPLVFVTTAGLSNALSGLCDANTVHPVIACPQITDRFGEVDVFSSLRMPRGVSPMVVLDPENAAVAATKILAEADPGLRRVIEEYQSSIRERVEEDDRRLRG